MFADQAWNQNQKKLKIKILNQLTEYDLVGFPDGSVRESKPIRYVAERHEKVEKTQLIFSHFA